MVAVINLGQARIAARMRAKTDGRAGAGKKTGRRFDNVSAK
jgi:hypothetical protein